MKFLWPSYLLTYAFFLTNLCLLLLLLGNDISFDHIHYLDFFYEIKDVTFDEYLINALENIPYYRWAEDGKFEVGFSFLSYVLTGLFSVKFVYILLALISLTIKFYVCVKLRVSVLLIIPIMIVSVMLFETNALRAGLSVSFLMLAYYFYLKPKLYLVIIFTAVAISMHLSSIFYVLIPIVYVVLGKYLRSHLTYIIFVLVGSVLVVNIGTIFIMLGGKLKNYYVQALEYGLYTGASGLNSATVLLLALVFWLLYVKKSIVRHDDYIFLYVTTGLALLGLFSGILSVVFDRLFHFYIVMLPMFLSRYMDESKLYFGDFFLVLMKGRLGVSNTTLMFVNLMLLYYAFIITLCLYPQSNVFYYVSGLNVFKSPELQLQ